MKKALDKITLLIKYFPISTFKIKFNWAFVLLFVFVWNYGFYGSLLTYDVSLWTYIISTTLMILIILFLALSGLKNKNDFIDHFTFDTKDILVFLSYLIFIFSLSFNQLTSYVKFDQLAQSLSSHLHAQKILESFPDFFQQFSNYSYKHLLLSIDIIILSCVLLLILILKRLFKNNYFIAISIIITTFLVFRTVIYISGGYGSGVPAFRLFPIWLSSTLLGNNFISFKLPGVFALIICMCFFQKRLNIETTFSHSWLFGLFIGTIPLLLYTSAIVEPSIWSVVFFSILLLNINQEVKLNYFRWINILIIFLLLRQSVIAAFVPILILIIKDRSRSLKFIKKNYNNIFLSLMVWLPFFLYSLFVGTGATTFIYDENPIKLSIMKLIDLIESDIIMELFKNDIRPLYLIVFFTFAFVPLDRSKVIIKILNFLFFIFAFLTFAIVPSYADPYASRYQTEYIIPFVLIGFYLLNISLLKYMKSKYLPSIFIVIMIFINIRFYYIHYNYKNYDKTNFETLGSAIYCSDVFDYKSLNKYLKEKGYSGNSIFFGTKTHPFSNILHDYSYEAINKMYDIFEKAKIGPKGLKVNSIKNIKDIKFVIVEDLYILKEKPYLSSHSLINGTKYYNQLIDNGWKLDTTFYYDDISEIRIYSQ